MVQVRYTGLGDPKAAFATLRPYHQALINMQIRCKPFGPEYMVLQAAQQALETACFHFTRDPVFYASPPPGSAAAGLVADR
jgi:hypothetical protein